MATRATPEASAPWRVFSPTATVYASPDRNGAPVGESKQGAELFGEYMIAHDTDEEWLKTTIEGRAAWIPRIHLHRIHPANIATGNIAVGTEHVDRWWGLPLDYEPDDLVPTPERYRVELKRDFPLRREASDALVAMLDAALADGTDIRITSAYRSGEYQTTLYTNAIARSGAAQRFSAPPGHSEHQLGTCADLTDPGDKFSFTEAFGSTPQGLWLEANAARFGFRRSYYPHNVKDTGYISEPWHWRYWGR